MTPNAASPVSASCTRLAHRSPAMLPAPALFDITKVAKDTREGRIVRVELEHVQLAPNARRDVSPEGIDRLAQMLARSGQLVPCIGYRPSRTGR